MRRVVPLSALGLLARTRGGGRARGRRLERDTLRAGVQAVGGPKSNINVHPRVHRVHVQLGIRRELVARDDVPDQFILRRVPADHVCLVPISSLRLLLHPARPPLAARDIASSRQVTQPAIHPFSP